MNEKKFGGRPRREPVEEGERVHLGFRVTPELKRRIEAAAQQSGRSQSQEAEARLERSFAREDLLSEALTLAYGRRLAALLLEIGEVMDAVGRRTYGFDPAARRWFGKPYAYDQAMKAAVEILEASRPTGSIEPPDSASVADMWNWGEDKRSRAILYEQETPRTLAIELLQSLQGKSLSGMFEERALRIQALLGPDANSLNLPPATAEIEAWEKRGSSGKGRSAPFPTQVRRKPKEKN